MQKLRRFKRLVCFIFGKSEIKSLKEWLDVRKIKAFSTVKHLIKNLLSCLEYGFFESF